MPKVQIGGVSKGKADDDQGGYERVSLTSESVGTSHDRAVIDVDFTAEVVAEGAEFLPDGDEPEA